MLFFTSTSPCCGCSQREVRKAPRAQHVQVERDYFIEPANYPSEEEKVTPLPVKEEEDSKADMLSSTLASALAPHWSVRIRRNKRGVACTDIGVVGTATSEPGQEPQGSGLDVGEGGMFLKLHDSLGTDSVVQQQQQPFLETKNQRVGERGLTLGSQAHERASTLGSSGSTVGGWFEGSTPSHKLDHPTKAPVSNSVSLGVSWGRLDNRGVEGGVVFPVTPTSPFSPNLNVHRGVSQAGRQGDQPSLLSSKLTTSSHLLSLRRLNTIASSTHSETNAPSISSPTNHRDGETSSPHLSPTVNNDRASKTIRAHLSLTSSNDRDRERSKSLPYSDPPTYRTTERSRPLPLPTSNHREADTHRTHLFSTSPNSQNIEGTPRTDLPQTSRVYPNKTFPSKQTLLFSGVERSPRLERSGGTTFHLSSSPPSQYGHLDSLRSQPLPRGSTLRSTSRRQYTSLEDSVSNPSSPLLSPTTTTTINYNNNNHTSSLSSTSSNNNTGPCSTNDITSVNPQSSINNTNNTVQNTHTAPSQLQSPKTAYTPTTIPQPLTLKTSYVPSNPIPYTTIPLSMTTTQDPSTPPLSPLSAPPLGERTFTGSLARSPKKHQYPVEERVTAHRARQESLERQRSEETSRRLSRSHSHQSPADLTSSTAPTRPLRSVGCPAIFTSLRLGSPTWAMSLLSPQTPRTTKLQVWRGDSMHHLSIMPDTTVKEGGRALSERVSDHTSRFTFDHTGTDSTALGPQRKTSAPLSLPDFGSFYNPWFSSLPYSTLKSSRTTLGEFTHTTSPQTPLSPSPSTSPQTPLSPSTSPQCYPFYSHRRTGSRDSSKVVALETDSVINNSKQTSEDDVETLVYRISEIDSSTILDSIRLAQPCFPQHTPDTRVITDIKSNELSRLTSDLSQSSQHSQVIGSPSCQSHQNSNDSGALDTEKVVCKMESFLKSAVVPIQPQSPTKEAEKGQKGRNKMDLVLSRLQQTFRVNCLDDEKREKTPQPPSVSRAGDISDGTDCSESSDQAEEDKKDRWRENDGFLKPSTSFWAGSERTSDMTKENVRREHSQGLKDNKKARNRDQPHVMDLPQFDAYNDKSFTLPRNQPSRREISPTRRQFEAYKEERISRARKKPPQRDFSPIRHQPWDPSHSASLPAYISSSGSPRNTFSIFHFSHEDSKNDNVFHFNHEDSKNNNVLLSPRLHQTKKTTFLCEPGEGGFCSRVGQRGNEGCMASFSSCADLKYGLEAGRSFSVSSVLSSRPSGPGRISTGPRISSVSYLTDPALTFGEEVMTWDDQRVKGDWIKPMWDTHTTTGDSQAVKTTGDSQAVKTTGDSQAVKTTGDSQAVKTTGDSQAVKTTGDSQAVKTTGDSQAVNNWFVISDQNSKNERKTITANFTDPRKSRSKSLPRNVSWGSEVTCPSPTTTSTTTGRMWNPGSLETSHFLWDTERPATTPPSPLWSPASRRISRPTSSSSSSSASPSPTDCRVSQDSLSPRGRLPSRGYVSSLAAFEESDSDSAFDMDSDTTTDDEYCLAGDSGEKETEL
ncbi:serine-rich adhesin for platelets isoform X1 [Salmo salar]|uniref:Serine-rich adhesin for platelets isoform X1 n=2 Tax=Salmo salar TaxID=8030 RepID=A0A1S3QB85_SALSA|nr:serine-rich adhesin for platelets isoform X1 [Salmo salar]